jgi:hypothetical protein
VVRELFLSSLALGVFFAAKAGFAVHMYEARRASAVDSASVARGFGWLGKGYCAASVLWLLSALRGESVLGWFIGPLFLMLGTVYWLLARRSKAEPTWSPFQSPEVRDICAHLTPDERQQLMENGRHAGRQFAMWIVLPGTVATGALILSGWVGLVGASVFLVYLAVVVWPRLRAMQLTNKKLICESEWAREKGYSTTTLRLFEFPWSK